MRITLICIFLFFRFGSIATAQQVNPFDIKSRLSVSDLKDRNDPSVHKIFEDSDTLAEDSVKGSSESDTLDLTTVYNVSDSIDASSTNPFDVSLELEQAIRKDSAGHQTIQKANKLDVPSVPKQKKAVTQNFVFWIILFTIIILASILNLKRNSFSNLYRSISNENYLRLIQREENNGFSPLFIILNGLFYINGGLFLYLAFAHYGFSVDFNFFAIASFILFLVYLVRNVGMAYLAYVFPISKEANQYNFTVILYNNFIGIMLIVINLIIAYSPTAIATFFLYIGFIMFGLFYLLRIFRGFLNSASFISNHLFHFFLYLCTFEIATVFILVKGIQIWIS